MSTLATFLVLGLAAAEPSQAPIPDATPVHLGVSLRLTHTSELDAFRRAQQDPSSPEYHHWLTPAQFGERFGQSAKVYADTLAWLKAGGFEVTAYPNRTFIDATGTAAKTTKLLGVHLLPAPGRPNAHVPDGKPVLPPALAPYILNISGLDTRIRFHHRLSQTQGAPALGPQDLRRIYGVQPLLDQGYYGQGQQLVVLSEAEPPGPGTAVDPTVINYFLQNTSDARAKVVFDTLPNSQGDFDESGGGNTEFELDLEMQSVGAPGADTLTLVIPPASEVFTTGANEIASNLSLATAVSISLGTCEESEQEEPNLGQAFEDSVIQGTLEGQTWSAASGDSGADDCENGMTPAVDFPADVPEIVAAGGSMFPNPLFDANDAIPSYETEVTWNQPGGNGFGGGAGGGGISLLFPAPAYQSAFGFQGRSVPDIALIAGPPGASCDTTQAGQLFPVEGTSIASPLSAGFFALLASRVGCRLGDPHAALYALGFAMFDGGAQVFHDITLGTVSLNGVLGPDAGIGFDSATGWGSLNVEALAAAWPSCGDAGVVGAGDAGVPYEACAFIDCQGAAQCQTVAEGPSGCIDVCDTRVDGGCALGTICSNQTLFTDGGFGSCVAGCTSAADCFPDSGATVCDQCTNECVTPGAADASVGVACSADSQCPTGGTCLTEMGLFTGGYCSLVCDPFDSNVCACPAGATCANLGESGQCLQTCPSPGFGCDRAGYACQPQLSGSPACLPACSLVDFGGQTIDTCQFLFGGDAGCDLDSGVCGGPVPYSPDAGRDAGVDAGADGGAIDGFDGGLDGGGPDGGTTPATPAAGGCGCMPGAGSPESVLALVALAAWLQRRRRSAFARSSASILVR